MNENDLYINKIKERLNGVLDKELVRLINKLIDERNYLSEIASIDTLTGLNNRRIVKYIRKCDGILMMDIDDFKSINDSFGHDIGDYVLKGVAQILKNNVRICDYAFRFGGDEFVVAFSGCPKEVILDRCEKVRSEINDKMIIQNKNITVSVGVALNENNLSVDELMKNADIALYESKRNGKNQVTRYTDEIIKTLKK